MRVRQSRPPEKQGLKNAPPKICVRPKHSWTARKEICPNVLTVPHGATLRLPKREHARLLKFPKVPATRSKSSTWYA
jgi:hypothetical protein